MAAFTENEVAQIFEILGVPPAGAALAVRRLGPGSAEQAGEWEPAWSAGDLRSLVDAITACLAATTEAQRTRVRLLLAQWDQYGPASTLATSGEAALNAPGELRRIREQVGNLLGVVVPPGGFSGELRRAASGAGDR